MLARIIRMGRMRRVPRIYHGPVNIANIGHALSTWQRQQGAVSDFIVFRTHTFYNTTAYSLNLDDYRYPTQLLIQWLMFCLALIKYDLFHFYYGRTCLPFGLDLPLLKLFGKKIIMTYCGSDIRLYALEKRINPYVAYIPAHDSAAHLDGRKKRMMRWQRLWVDKFIAVRGHYLHAIEVIPAKKVIEDIWVTNTIQMDTIQASYSSNNPPVLVHSPSDPLIKGTAHVEEAIEALRQAGYAFDYVRLEAMPHTQIMQHYQTADIILDQFYLGTFGTTALEGMSHGKVVCAYVSPQVMEMYPDCPVVSCTVDNLKEKLMWLLDHPEERLKISQAGRAFAVRHADWHQVNQRLWAVYQDLLHYHA